MKCGCKLVAPFTAQTLCLKDGKTWHKGEYHPKTLRIWELEANRPRLIDYLKMKQDSEDWHGVQDAASDLRDLDSELDGLRY